MMFRTTPSSNIKILNSKGQILVEYLLLMVIAVACATILIKGLIGRGDSPGIIINKWDQIITIIGNDIPDCANQTDFKAGAANRCRQ